MYRAAAIAMCLALGTTGCATEPASSAGTAIYRAPFEVDSEAQHLARMMTVIRQDAQIAYARYCDGIEIPDEAFIPVELTGGLRTELAVSLVRAKCNAGLNLFSGSGGEVVQFWSGESGPVRLLLEQQMHGFTPLDRGLLTFQHGGACPDGAGPEVCLVTYAWTDKGRRLETATKVFGARNGPEPQYGYAELTGIDVRD